MGVEIERKFLAIDDDWRGFVERMVQIRQGYVVAEKEATVRARIAGDRAFITLKGDSSGARRSEFEYPIPVADAEEILATLCGERLVEKCRHYLTLEGAEWVVDVFSGENAGLVLVEVEGRDEAALEAALEGCPAWLGREVTSDERYSNARLASRPYARWRDEPG